MKELKQIEKLIGKKLRRLESEWPMQVFDETVKQPRPPRPGRESKPETHAEKKHPAAAAKVTCKPQKQMSVTAPVSKATPLERPVSVQPARTVREDSSPRSIQRSQAEKPAFTYADLLKERRKARRPISTGNDRF